MNDVVIVGGGPTGMMLAGELTLAGVDVGDRRATSDAGAGGLARGRVPLAHASRSSTSAGSPTGSSPRGRSRRRRASAARCWTSATSPRGTRTRSACGRTTSSGSCSAGSRSWGCRSIAGVEVTGFAQDDNGVDVHARRGRAAARARTSSAPTAGAASIRKAAGIEFPGWDATRSNLIAEVEVTEEIAAGHAATTRSGSTGCTLMEDGRTVRVVVTEQRARAGHRADAGGPRRGADGPSTAPTSGSTTRPGSRGSPTPPGRRRPTATGRVLLAGDAAHIHSPGGRAGDRPRHPGRRQPRLEARPGGQGHLARRPAGHLPRRAAPGRRPRAEAHDGADRRCSGPTRGSTRCATSSPTC